jgi:hypothetical protein
MYLRTQFNSINQNVLCCGDDLICTNLPVLRMLLVFFLDNARSSQIYIVTSQINTQHYYQKFLLSVYTTTFMLSELEIQHLEVIFTFFNIV